ncbi:hypothetical protein [Cryptosporangium aurantiacum]|uniref:Uncharacterized protein n=1 Tax=Cryptosporangium aurantiacum TaxID=134849 RepID=A0A1M7RMY3_9ACTN|nr:hypothetical protein [Cryptosporangium aurantiacum]SHN47561.1 hypothetical protein SAMN05443668_12521 [Cryptosporangium aurantiacum]
MSGPFGEGRHRSTAFDDDAPTAPFLLDPDTEDETPTARFVLNPYRGLLEYDEDDAPTARFVLNPYREPSIGREAHDPFGGFAERAPAVIEGEVVWPAAAEPASGSRSVSEPEPERPVGEAASDVSDEPRFDDGPGDDVPGDDVPEGDVPEGDVPGDDASEGVGAGVRASGDRVSGHRASGHHAAGHPVSGHPVSGQHGPGYDRAEAGEPAASSPGSGDLGGPDERDERDEPEPEPEPVTGLGPHTVAGAANRIVEELAPAELARFPIVARRFFTDEMLRRRVIRWSLSGAKRDDPLALQLGGDNAELVTPLTLAMLTCAATGVLGHVGTRHHNGVVRWRRNRKAASRRPIHGPATTLPHLSSLGAATVGHIVDEAAEEAGLTADRARRLSILIVSALTAPLHKDSRAG